MIFPNDIPLFLITTPNWLVDNDDFVFCNLSLGDKEYVTVLMHAN